MIGVPFGARIDLLGGSSWIWSWVASGAVGQLGLILPDWLSQWKCTERHCAHSVLKLFNLYSLITLTPIPMDTQQPMNSKQHLLTLSIIHVALFAGQVLFLVVAMILSSTGQAAAEGAELLPFFWILAPSLGLVGHLGGRFLFRRQMQQAHNLGLTEKLNHHRAATIVKLALMEAPAILATVGVLLTGNSILVVLAGVMIVLFFFQKPSHLRLLEELQPTDEERKMLEREESTQG